MHPKENSRSPKNLAGVIVLLFFLQTTSHAALDVWQWLNPRPTGNAVDGVTFINGQFFVCSATQVFVSPDGNQWVTYLVPGNPSLYRIAYGAGLYVAVGETTTGAGVIVTSTNLQDWTSQSTSNALFAVAYGNGMFVAAGYGGTLLTSTNGSNWVARASGTTTALKSIAFGNGVFVASTGDIFGDPSISVSSDGVTWTRQDIVAASPSRAICSVSFIQGRFYAAGWYTYPFPPYYSVGVLNFSTDGTNWTAAGNPNSIVIRTVFNDATNVYAMEVYYPAGQYFQMLKSTDGTNFFPMTTVNFSAANVANGYAYDNGKIVGAGGVIQTSINGTNWTTVSGPNPLLTDVAWGNGTCVAVGASGSIIASVAGGPFVSQTSPVASQLYRVLFANGLFHSVGGNGALVRSTNGTYWVQRNSSTGNHLRSLCYGNGLYVAVGDGGTVITSPNGLTWTTRSSGTSSALEGLTCASNLFVAVGGGGTVVTSSDAINWTAQFADTLQTLLDVTFGSNQFVAVGANGVICTSPDGTNWTTQTSGTTDQLQAVAFTGGTFLAVGNVLLVSTNGSTWTSGNSGTSFRLYGARSFNGTFLLAGDNGTILQSSLPGALQLAGNVDAGGGKFIATIRGGLGQSFRLQSSDALAPAAWTDRIGFTNAPNPATFIDPAPASQSMRFYRLIIP